MKKSLEDARDTAREILKAAAKKEGNEVHMMVEQVLPLLEWIERELRGALSPGERGKFLSACEAVLGEASITHRKRLVTLIGAGVTEDDSKSWTCEIQMAVLGSGTKREGGPLSKQRLGAKRGSGR